MKGQLLEFVLADGHGVISGDDGQRYGFTGQDWKSKGALPSPGMRVDFVGTGDAATEIYADPGVTGSARLASLGLDERYGSFYRSSDEHVVFGVCGGLAHKFGVPTGVMRAIVFISMFFGVGLFYFAGIFLPKLPTRGVPQPG